MATRTQNAATETKRWTINGIEGLVIDLLANLKGKDVADLTAEMDAKGNQLPVDSLDMFDVLAEFRQKTGIKLPARDLKQDDWRSVKKFAKVAAAKGRQK